METPKPRFDWRKDWLEYLVQHRRQSAYVFLGLALVFLAIPISFGVIYHQEYLSVCSWGASLTLISLFAGLFQLLRDPEPGEEPSQTRQLILGIGGLAGLATVFLGVALNVQWWETIYAFLKGSWPKDFWRILVAELALLGGELIMLASFQLARTEVRTDPTLRRILYGYNTIFGLNLVVLILVLVNVLGAAWYEQTINFRVTSRGLAPLSIQTLKGLDKPVKVYVVLNQGDAEYDQLRLFLNQCREVTKRIEVEYLSPDLNVDRINELAQKYQFLDRRGVLLVAGSGEASDFRFIPRREFMDEKVDPGTKRKEQFFTGEDAIMTELHFLASGKAKPAVYFTQGHGELDLNNSKADELDRGIGVLRTRLDQRNVSVRPLPLGGPGETIPEDASIVIIVRPTFDFSTEAIQALDAYMNPPDKERKKGKLIVLFDLPNPSSTQSVPRQPRLERYLQQFNIEVGEERVLALNSSSAPFGIVVHPNPDLEGQNPVVASFSKTQPMEMVNCRSVRPLRKAPGFHADTFIETVPGELTYLDPDTKKDASQIVRESREASSSLAEAKKRGVTRNPVSLAVVVTEIADGKHQGRLVVFGDATFVSNGHMVPEAGRINFDLFASTVDWLRDQKTARIGIPAQKNSFYTLDKNFDFYRAVRLPPLLMSVAILGLGLGVWVVRRR